MNRRTGLSISWPAVVAVILLTGLDVFVLWASLDMVQHSVYVPFSFETGDRCRWEASGAELGGADRAPLPSGACLDGIAGLPIEATTLVRDPAYLRTADDYRSWRAAQRELRQRLGAADETTLEFTTKEGKGLQLTVPVQPFSWRQVDLAAWGTLLTALATVGFGCFVFLRRPGHGASRLMLLFAQGMFMCAIPSAAHFVRGLAPPEESTFLLYVTNHVAFQIAAAMLLCLTIWFPVPWFSEKIRTAILVGAGLFAATAISLPFVDVPVGTAMTLAGGVEVTLSLIMVGFTHFRPMAQVQRAQASWVLWGLLMPSILWAVTRIPYLLGVTEGAPPTDELLFLFATTIPVGLGVAILRYRLLDIKVIIRRTVMGTAVVSLVLLVYSALFSAFASDLAGEGPTNSNHAVAIVSAIILAFTILPSQNRLEDTIDRLFFRNRYHYRQVLARTPDNLADLHRPQEVAEEVLHQTCAAMEIPRMVIALPSDAPSSRLWFYDDDDEELPTSPPPDGDPFWESLHQAHHATLFDPTALDDPLHQWLDRNGLDVAFPLQTRGALAGVMACRTPRRTRLIAPGDVNLLRTVAASLALALSRANAFEDLRLVNEGLESTVATRTAELEKARLQLFQWEKMASLGVLAAGVAHELNTPLEVVTSTAEQLVTDLEPKDEQARARPWKLAKLCQQAAGRAGQIVRDLTNFSRPEAQDVQLLEVGELIDSTLRILGPSLRRARVQVEVDLVDLPNILGYSALVAQTVANLVLNGIAAIGQDGNITISARPGPGTVTITVQDSGPGIPPDLKDRIFEPFFTTKPPGQGTGLGLSLCHTFVTQHGGRIWEDAPPGEGARFVVELPLAIPQEVRERQLKLARQPG